MPRNVMLYAEKIKELRAAGGRAGRPDHVSGVAESCDREIVRSQTICPDPDCGQQGLRYEAWSVRGQYVALAVCPVCGACEEF